MAVLNDCVCQHVGHCDGSCQHPAPMPATSMTIDKLDPKGLEAAKTAYRLAEESPEMIKCTRCAGFGYVHGFGEDGYDPDWCPSCGGPGFELAAGEEDRPLREAITAYRRASTAGVPGETPRVTELATALADQADHCVLGHSVGDNVDGAMQRLFELSLKLRFALSASLSSPPVSQQAEAVAVGEQWRALEYGSPKTSWYYEKQGDRAGWEALAKREPTSYRIETRALYASPAPDAVEPVAWVRMKTLDPSKPLKATTIKDIADGWMKAGHKVKPLVIRSALHTSPVSAPGVVEKLEQLPRYAETTAPGPRGSDSVVAEMTRDPHGEWLDRDEVLAALQEGK